MRKKNMSRIHHVYVFHKNHSSVLSIYMPYRDFTNDDLHSSLQAAHEQIIKNLQRENAMIATAWYDLTSRLQSNHVVLQRKDQPKSWLNKQRQMVNGE